MSIWLFIVNTRVMEAMMKGQPLPENLTAVEIYMYIYSCWGGPSFFVFLIVWMAIAKPHLQIKLPGAMVWWITVVFFVVFMPTVLLPISAVGLWAICTKGNKALIESAVRDAAMNDRS